VWYVDSCWYTYNTCWNMVGAYSCRLMTDPICLTIPLNQWLRMYVHTYIQIHMSQPPASWNHSLNGGRQGSQVQPDSDASRETVLRPNPIRSNACEPSRTSTLVRMKQCLMCYTAFVSRKGFDIGIEGSSGSMTIYNRCCCLAGLSSSLLGNFGYKAV
jgi:hypothetical protein